MTNEQMLIGSIKELCTTMRSKTVLIKDLNEYSNGMFEAYSTILDVIKIYDETIGNKPTIIGVN